jgi:hypothetical protein
MADDDDFPLDANGPAYTSRQERDGVPLAYVGEKLGRAIEELHRYAANHPDQRGALQHTMYFLLVAHLGLHNMLAKTADRTLPLRLLGGSRDQLDAWLELIEREGDVQGLAGLDPDR